ncbi:MAG TPA: alpha/beta fold hydrolase [Candidatus Dormibacteraeota bacterium]|nr:alpha/beta fold hydrolase [Candidatus Dormibacteraeota bacterium]
MAKRDVVLIHGLFMTALSWEAWVERYTARGYNVVARSWPRMEVDIEALRRDPSALAGMGVEEVVDHFDRIIRALDAPPFVIGHSFGGAFTEILLDRGLGAAGVAIDAAQLKGIYAVPPSQLRALFPIVRNPANRGRAVAMTHDQFHYAFTNTLTAAESQDAFRRYAVPGPGRLLFQAALANLDSKSPLTVDFAKADRAPLLIIAGGSDHIVPASLNAATARRYAKSSALTEYRLFPGRGHWTCAEPGWEEVADYAIDWCERNAARAAAP